MSAWRSAEEQADSGHCGREREGREGGRGEREERERGRGEREGKEGEGERAREGEGEERGRKRLVKCTGAYNLELAVRRMVLLTWYSILRKVLSSCSVMPSFGYLTAYCLNRAPNCMCVSVCVKFN